MVDRHLFQKLFMLFLCFSFFITTHAYAEEQRIYDDAGLLTDEEVIALENQAATYFEEWQTDFIIVTTNNETGEHDIKYYMQDFTDGLAEQFNRKEDNMAVLAIDMNKRDVYLAGFGFAESHLDNNRLTQIREKITPDLSDENYYSAFGLFFEKADEYLAFRPGVNPESLFFNTFLQLAIAIAIGAIIVFILAYRSGGRVTTTSATYLDKENTELLRKRDQYIRKTVTRTKKPSSNKNSGGGGFRGGGGGISSGGRSHSGSRGSF